MASPIRAACFDYGGVLGSSEDDWKGALHSVVDASGLSTGEVEGLWRHLWPAMSVGASDMPEFWHAMYLASPHKLAPGTLEEKYAQSVVCDENVLRIADDLRAKGLRLAIAANGSQSGMNLRIKKFGLASRFEKVYCSAAMGITKPDPGIFAYISHDLGLSPEGILLIDDEQDDLRNASEAGIRTILYRNPAQLRTALERELNISLYR